MIDDPYNISFKDYIDSQFAEIHRAVELAATVPKVEGIPLREYVDAMFQERRKLLETTAEEREKAQELQRDTYNRASDTAEAEREKAAAALRTELSRSISEGDERLREHIMNQIMQIREALVSAEKLELERISAADERTNAVKRELANQAEAQERAVAKAEAANEKRFEGVNEWRSQSADRERSQQEQMSILTGTFLPREVAESQFADIRRTLAEITEKLGKLT